MMEKYIECLFCVNSILLYDNIAWFPIYKNVALLKNPGKEVYPWPIHPKPSNRAYSPLSQPRQYYAVDESLSPVSVNVLHSPSRQSKAVVVAHGFNKLYAWVWRNWILVWGGKHTDSHRINCTKILSREIRPVYWRMEAGNVDDKSLSN